MDILESKIVTTRNPHVCDACLRKFEPGTKMFTQTVVDSGDIWKWRLCPTCYELLTKYPKDFNDGYGCYEGGCVDDSLGKGETPEMLLESYNKNNNGS